MLLQFKDSQAAYSEAEELVKQLKDALREKRQAIAAAEKDLAPVIDEADQVAAEVNLTVLSRILTRNQEHASRLFSDFPPRSVLLA